MALAGWAVSIGVLVVVMRSGVEHLMPPTLTAMSPTCWSS